MESKRMKTSPFTSRAALVLALSLSMLACGVDNKGSDEPNTVQGALQIKDNVLRPNQSLFGKSYAQYATAHFQQLMAQPMTGHPALDGGDCAQGNSGAVWNLIGGMGGNNTVNFATHACTVPANTWLNVSPMWVECSIWEDVGTTPSELRACAKEDQDGVTIVEMTIDGVPVPNLVNRHRFLTDPVAFTVTLPADNIFGPGAVWESATPPAAGTYPNAAVGEGFFALVAPLSPGQHVITTRGVIPGTEGPFGSFESNVTFNLTVQ
jgi:hypothetical protein